MLDFTSEMYEYMYLAFVLAFIVRVVKVIMLFKRKKKIKNKEKKIDNIPSFKLFV